MNSLLPFDLTEIVYEELMRQRRDPDGLLHASSHLNGSLRHAQLDVAGAPRVQSELIREFPLWIGHMMHEWLHDTLRRLGVPYMAEVNMNPWLPPGWGGTLDALVWNPEFKAFVLADFKTSKGESMRYIRTGGAKEDHIKQTSLYWHAAKKMGVPIAKAITVYYLPKNDTRSKDELIEPILVDFEPMSSQALMAEAKRRRERVHAYEDSLPFDPISVQIRAGADKHSLYEPSEPLSAWLTDELEPVQERTQRIYFDRATETHEVKLVPHWSTAFCEFPDELCSCSTQGTTKIGMYDIDGTYYPRKGYEEIEPTVAPS